MNVQNLLGKPVDSCFEEAERTGKLQLSKRNLREFPKSSVNYDMQDIYSIEMSNNKFKRVPEALKNCMILTRLDLHNNFIREFSQELKNLPSLKELILSRNSLTAFPLVITTYNLEYLDISCNLIKSVPEDIRVFKKLKVLNLSSNYLKLLPNTIGQLSSLRQLNASRNKLEQVPEELQYCPLMKLDLSFNKLHMIPPSFRHLIRLQDINLDSNPLRHPPAKLCSLGKAHIFKYLSLLASHMDGETSLTSEEKEMQKRYREAQEKQLYRPMSVKSNFEDFEIEPYDYSPAISQMSLNTPSSSAMDDYRMTTPDVPDAFHRMESSQAPDYTSIYHDYLRRDKNSNDDLDIPNGRYSPDPNANIMRKRSTRKPDSRRRSSLRESEQKPVLSMYATLPRAYRRPTTPSTGDSEDGGQELMFRLQPKSRPALSLSPYLKRPFDNIGSDEHENIHPKFESKRSFEHNQDEGKEYKPIHKQMNLVAQIDPNRSSSSTSGGYFAAPFSYTNEILHRSKSQKVVSRSDAPLDNRSRTNSNPPTPPIKRSESELSEGSTVSDTTPKASPEPREIITPPPEAVLVFGIDNKGYLPPPPPPPRTFALSQQDSDSYRSPPSKLNFTRTTSAKVSVDRSPSPLFQDSDRYFRTKKRSTGDTEGEEHQNLTIRRKEYNVHITSSQIDYILKEVKERLGITIEEGTFTERIKDGVLACQLVNLVTPDLIQIHFPEGRKPLSTKYVTLNIEKFLDGCRQVGVPTNFMCSSADIVNGQDITKVLKNFVHLLNSSSV